MKLKTKLVLTETELDDFYYASAILDANKNSHGDKEMDRQSVRASNLFDKLLQMLNVDSLD